MQTCHAHPIGCSSSSFALPLAEVLTDAKHEDHTHFELITATITTEDGFEGTGYTYTGGRGERSIRALLEYDIMSSLIGQNSSCIDDLYDATQWHVHYVARGGIAGFGRGLAIEKANSLGPFFRK